MGNTAPKTGSWPREASGDIYSPNDLIGGKYRLQMVIGEGGMGSVWLARNVALDADVALKLVRCDLLRVKVAADRLLREARVAARLEHPSIVRVFDFGETERGDPYIVMELVNGEQLADLLERKGRLAATHAVQLLLPVCSALAAAHAQGIVHRDVKPDNILLVPTEAGLVLPKLVDFGIATLGEARGGKRITQMGEAIGTPEYMSPEQLVSASEVDGRSDVWSLAVVLYESIVGPLPFEGDSFAALAAAVLTREPRPIADFGAGDEALWAIIARGLAKKADERWPSMRTFGAALAGWALERGVTTDVAGGSLAAQWQQEGAPAATAAQGAAEPTDPPPRSVSPQTQRNARVVAAIGLAAAAIGVIAYVGLSDAPVSTPTPATTATTPVESASSNSTPATSATSGANTTHDHRAASAPPSAAPTPRPAAPPPKVRSPSNIEPPATRPPPKPNPPSRPKLKPPTF